MSVVRGRRHRCRRHHCHHEWNGGAEEVASRAKDSAGQSLQTLALEDRSCLGLRVAYPPLPLLLALEPFEQVGTIHSRTASPRDRFQSTGRRDLIERQLYGGPGPEIRRARPNTRSGSTRSSRVPRSGRGCRPGP